MHIYRKVKKSLGKYEKIFEYYNKNGKKIGDNNVIEYVRSLKIPPNYIDVEINLNKNAKILATGYDQAGRKQYIYNQKFVEKRMDERFCKMIAFSKKIHVIENDVDKLLASRNSSKEKNIALIIRIIMHCNFRIGNEIGKEKYNSYGISTLLKKHINIKGNKTVIDFIGKKGVRNHCTFIDAKIRNSLDELCSKKKNGDSVFDNVSSNDVNNFLKKYGDFTTKDFRTWYANVYFIDEMRKINKYSGIEDTEAKRKKQIKEAVGVVAERLHHTIAICKKKYIIG